MCVDYHDVNNIIVKYKHLIHTLDDMLDELYGFYAFLKINLKNKYHHIRMKKNDEWKTSFKNKYDLYEWVMGLLVILMYLLLSRDW